MDYDRKVAKIIEKKLIWLGSKTLNNTNFWVIFKLFGQLKGQFTLQL